MKTVMMTAQTVALTAALLVSTSAYSQGGGGVGSARATQSGLIGRTQQGDSRGARAEATTQTPSVQPPSARPDRGRPSRDPAMEGRGRDGRPAGVVAQEQGRRQFDRDGLRGDRDWNRGDRDRTWSSDGRAQRDGDWRRPRRDRDRGRPAYEARRWPHHIQPRQRYRWYGPAWINPPGFNYPFFSYGQRLPSQWYSQRYYLIDYMRYGLPMPPAGFEWVRLGRDAVLVDVFDGRIYQVVRNLFW